MFSEIYGSWQVIQKEKFEMIFKALGDDFLKNLENKKILDIGAGSGFLGDFLSGTASNITAMDPDKVMVNAAKSKANFVLGNAEQMPFQQNTFDAAFCIDSIHLFDPDISVLKRDGLVVVSVFFNDGNYNEKRDMVISKLNGFEIQREFIVPSREKEFVVIARKIL